MKRQVFHLAIPTHDLEAAKDFYVNRLNCRLAREYKDRITLDFFGEQVVCHFAPDKVDGEPEMYPRHFGVTFADRSSFEEVLARAREGGLAFFAEPFVRFQGMEEEHHAFFLKDPSNNLLEFKYYLNSEMMY